MQLYPRSVSGVLGRYQLLHEKGGSLAKIVWGMQSWARLKTGPAVGLISAFNGLM